MKKLWILLLFLPFISSISWNGGGAGISDHNSLTGLEGGSPGEYYHLDQSFYDRVLLYAFSWLDETTADTLYSDIIWGYNQTLAGVPGSEYAYNHTEIYNNTMGALIYNYSNVISLSEWNYNQTIEAINNLTLSWGEFWYNYSLTFSGSFSSINIAYVNISNNFLYNQNFTQNITLQSNQSRITNKEGDISMYFENGTLIIEG